MLALMSLTASAQRTAYGERQLNIEGHASPVPSYGAALSYGQYLLNTFWEGGVTADNYIKLHKTDGLYGNLRVEGYGAFFYRIYGTRNRQLSVYVGGDLFLGFEFLDPFKRLTQPGYQSLLNKGNKAYQFIYGVSPRAEAEFFVSRDIALVLRMRVPVTLNTQIRSNLVDIVGALGVRYNF